MRNSATFFLSLFIFLFSSINIFSQAPVITKQPSNQGVIEGQSATFTFDVTGDTLTYQWYKDGAAISGATDSVYTTPTTVLADNGSLFSVKITNSYGSDSSNVATLFVTAAGSRVTSNLQLLYNFNETSGDSIYDNSGAGTPYSLSIDNPSAVTWTPKGLGVNDIAYINADNPATKVINSSKSTNEITLEAWVIPAFATQRDGARILTLSQNTQNSDFSLMQSDGFFRARVRTTTTSLRGNPGLTSSAGTATSELTHLVFTRTSNGDAVLYKNGTPIMSDTINGDFSNWDSSYRLQIANEFESPRQWLGTYYLVAVYNRALSQNEVQENYNVGVNIDHKPEIIIEPNDTGLFEGQSATFSVSAVGDAPVTYQWRKNGIDISGANSESYTIPSVSVSNNGDQYSVLLNNASGSDVSRNAVLYVTAVDKRVTSGQIALYEFQEGVGDTIKDNSGYGTPLNLKINNQNAVMWKPYGLVVDSIANIVSTTNASKINNEVITSGEFTFETWVKPSDLVQSPATIFTISANTTNRNFTVNQAATTLQTRLRSSKTSAAGNSLISPVNSVKNKLIHVVYVHNTKEISKIYIDGIEVSTSYITGNLSSWNSTYSLKISNQFSASQLWKGTFNLISFYNRALDSAEIAHNYNMGPLGNISVKAPGNLTANALHAGMVSITWKDSSDNEDGFIVERQEVSPNPSAFIVIDTVKANDTSYTDLTVSDTTTYNYRVKAYNLIVESGYSNEVNIKTLLSVIPAPTDLVAIKYNPDTTDIKLTWKDNSSNELGFVIQRKPGDSASVSVYVNIDTTNADVTSFTDSTTSDTTKYTYRIYAYNADTVSAFSNVETVTTPLPVELTSFSVNEINGKVLLTWETATEINNAGFSVERSPDNKKFSEVAFIKGKGTTTEKTSYRYTDKSALSGKYYFRLKQVDFDGTYQYTKSIEIDMGLPNSYALEQNYPNPFNPSTTIRFALPVNAKVSIKLYNTLGQEVANILNNNLDAGVHETIFNASNLSSGVYFYRLEVHGIDGSNFISTKRMLLMK